MTREEIFRSALVQSAIDCNCRPDDFLKNYPVIVVSKKTEEARKYLDLPFACQLVSYGNNIVASVREDLKGIAEDYLSKHFSEHCFETPALHEIDAAFASFGIQSRYMAEYFLPDVNKLKEYKCKYRLRFLEKGQFEQIYQPEWSNAISFKRPENDVLCLGAYDGETLVGLAGASADCECMWQIGMDVLPAYRRQGIARALTSQLALEILRRGKTPFYCAAWSNIKSVRNALSCGFYPAWVELTFTQTEKK